MSVRAEHVHVSMQGFAARLLMMLLVPFVLLVVSSAVGLLLAWRRPLPKDTSRGEAVESPRRDRRDARWSRIYVYVDVLRRRRVR